MSLRAAWLLFFAAWVGSMAFAQAPNCDPPNFCIWADDDTCGRCFDGHCEDGVTFCQFDAECTGIGGGACLNNDASTWKTCTADADCAGVGLGLCYGLCVNDRSLGCLTNPECAAVGGACDVSHVGDGSAANPFCRIQRAYNGAKPNTTPANPIIIPVNPGTYTECVTAWGFIEDQNGFWDPLLSEDRPVELVAVDFLANGDRSTTVIDATAACGPDVEDPLVPDSAVKIGGTGALLDGFTITGGGLSGVYAQGEVAITNNVISGNQSDLGGGIYLLTASCYYEVLVDAVIADNVIENNDAVAPLSALDPACQICLPDAAPCGTGDGGGIFAVVDDVTDCGTTRDHVAITGNTIRFNTVTNANPDYCTATCDIKHCEDGTTFCQLDDDCAGIGSGNCSGDPCDLLALPCGPGDGECVAAFPYTASGGGIFVITDSQALRTASATITQNLIAGNSIVADPPAQFSEGYGGGVYAVTFGIGADTIEISDNCIGGGDLSNCSPGGANANSATLDGGGISARVRPFGDGEHRIDIAGNVVTGNSAGRDGGGLELLTEVIELDATGDGAVVTVSDNEITDNTSDRDGGGVKAVADVRRTAQATTEMGLTIRGNEIRDNTSGLGGGGIIAVPIADYDDINISDGLCGDFPSFAEARIDIVENLIVDNTASASDPDVDVIGGGILALPFTFGDARASVVIDQTTVAGNSIGENGIVGGIEAQAITYTDCLTGTLLGSSHLVIDRTIVAANKCPDSAQCIGVGGPNPGVDVLVAAATSNDVSGHSPNYESSLFDASPPAGNITGSPQLDAGTYFPAACSPVFQRFCHGSLAACDEDEDCGSFCSAASDNWLDVCVHDGNCPNGTCLQRCVDAVGYYANPDATGDGAVDGHEVLAIAASFGAEEGDARYDAASDINRNGENDGDDLSFLTSEFGQVCEP